MEKKLAFALDVETSKDASEILHQIEEKDIIIKIGYSLFIRDGIRLSKLVKDLGFELFVDLKLHDIPNTVFNGVKAALDIGADYLTIHALGGVEMIEKAVQAKGNSNLKILAVTVLTSHSEYYKEYIGTKYNLKEFALMLGSMAVEIGVDGLVSSSHEVRDLKEHIKRDFIAVVPGIRFDSEKKDDQTRISTPEQAIKNGADIIVVGRPILNAKDKNLIIRKIKESIT